MWADTFYALSVSVALRFVTQAMKRYGNPLEIVSDRLGAYHADRQELGSKARQATGRGLTHWANTSHQPVMRPGRAMIPFRVAKSLQKFAPIRASLPNHYNQKRHLFHRETFKRPRTAALAQ